MQPLDFTDTWVADSPLRELGQPLVIDSRAIRHLSTRHGGRAQHGQCLV